MSKKIILLLGLVIYSLNGFTQTELGWEVNSSIKPKHIDFSENNRFMILDSESAYEVWNTNTNSKILQGKYRYKWGRNLPGVYLTEGSTYLLFENEEIFLQIDYTLNNTKVDAYDLTTGEKIWSLTNLDMGISDVETIYQIVSNAQRVVQNEDNFADASFTVATGMRSSTNKNRVPVSYVGHDKTIKKLINYLPQKNAISINGKNALQLLDLKTGEIIWEQPELKGGLGEIFYEPINDILIAVRVNNSELDNIASRPEVQALNAKNGDLLWTTKYNGDFIPEAAYVYNQTLILPYYGLMFIDINTGEELEGDVKEAMQRQRKIQRNMSVLGSEGLGDNCTLPILDENGIIHYLVGYHKGKHINPDGSKKAYLKIDAEKGEIISAEEGLAKQGNRVIQEELTNETLYVKLSKGLSSSYILALDKNSGKIVFETDKIKNRLGTDYDPFLLNDDRIIDVSSKGIHLYDAQNGNEIKSINYKKIGVGKFKNQLAFSKGIILIGTKGLAIINNQGEVKNTFHDIKKINDIVINDEIWILEKKRFVRMSLNPIEVIEEIQLQKDEQMFFSTNGKSLIKQDQTSNRFTIY
ncbi:MAG: PQQ-binding-like beta-propeller repeat protein [Bacteroidota bacterium]